MTDSKCYANFMGHGNEVTSVDFTCEKNTIVSSSTDRCLKLWDLQKEKCKKTIGCKSGIRSM